jgi:integrase
MESLQLGRSQSFQFRQHTLDHRDCPACEEAIQLQATGLPLCITFKEAFDIWIGQRVIDHQGIFSNVRFISARSEHDLRQYAKEAGRFFDNIRLDEIHVGHLREYQRARAVRDLSCGAWKQAAGANLIRKEIQTVVRVMKAAGAWTPHHEENFESVSPIYPDVPRAMMPDEQHQWLHVAGSREEWRIVYWWSIIALQTTAATNEMRAVRLGDIFLNQGTLQIRNEGAKNRERIRTIPLQTPEVVWALGGLIERAKSMGANGPHCYLFPLHITADRYNPLEPMTVWGLRKPWDAVRDATGLKWLRVYDLRHSAITRMAEAGVPIQVIMSFAGHISPFMQKHYTQISMQAKRRWAAAAWAGAEMPFAPGGMGPAPAPMQPERPGPQRAGLENWRKRDAAGW